MELLNQLKAYVQDRLYKTSELEKYIANASILAIEYENGKIWDLLILLDDNVFDSEFSRLYGKSFIVDDHVERDIFTKVKCYKWIKKDLAKRLSISLWVLENSLIIQDINSTVSEIINKHKEKFKEVSENILRGKYLELRGERHNLRFSVNRGNKLSSIIIKSNIVKLCFEICLLSEGKTYPFKLILPGFAEDNTEQGGGVVFLCNKFMDTEDPNRVIGRYPIY